VNAMITTEIENASATRASPTQRGVDEGRSIRAFTAQFSDAAIDDLRRRINATKWPERETVTDSSQGVQLATTQALALYWATDYDWRKVEARCSTPCRSSSSKSMAWTFISFTSAPNMKMRCR